MLGKINRTYSDLKRVQQIVHVLIKHGFGMFIEQMRKENHFIARQLKKWKILPDSLKEPDTTLTVPERLRKTLEELGPTYVKLGQILSTRPDLIPIDICEEFSKLQDQVPCVPYGIIRQQIISQFNKPPEEIFSFFDEQPVAAASLGQAHEAQLPDGTKVIVKIQRPNIDSVIKTDIAILTQLAELINRHSQSLRIYDLPGIIEQFSRTIRKEMDFTVEGRNIDRFAKNFMNHPHVHIPKIFWQYTRPKALTLEKINGVKLRDIMNNQCNEYDKKVIASRGADAILKQIFIHGFFHADPHPGNIFIMPDNKIAFVDFGIISRLSKELKSNMCDMLIGVVENDVDKVVDAIAKVGGISADIDIKRFKSEMEEFLDQYYEIPLSKIRIDQVLLNAVELIRNYYIKIPRDLYLMVKTMGIAEGIVMKLDPEFNMIGHTKPFVFKMIKKQYSPMAVARETKKVAKEFAVLAKSAPAEISQILNMMRKGTFKIEFEHQGLDNFLKEMDRSSNRISFSLVIAALIVGSCLVMLSKTGPLIMNMPVLGLIGFTLAGFLGFWLAIAILRSGKL